MWPFEVKPSTLLVMMTTVVLVFSAAVHPPEACEELRHKMDEELQRLDKAKLNISVLKPTRDDNSCPINFFCLAEMVLERIQKESDRTNLAELTDIFKRYNKKHPTSCELERTKKYSLHCFLTDVKECWKFVKCTKQ